MSYRSPWQILGIAKTTDRKAIRKAYAEKLKAMNPDEDVAGFSDLRNARDIALRQAAAQERGEEPVEPVFAPVETLDGFDGLALDDPDVDFEDDDWAITSTAPASVPIEPAQPEEPAEPTPDMVLHGLLFPDGEASEEAFSHEEYEVAQQCLQAILAHAASSDISRQNHCDMLLSHWLASAWPRSAPLVEEAAEFFEWPKYAGQLDEAPAVAFLNVRLQGMLFHAAVQQPGHRLHKGWVELQKPGRRSARGSIFAPKDEVRAVLQIIETRYPELESFLDPQRVGSWQDSEVGNPWSVVGTLILIFVVVLNLVRICAPLVESIEPETFDTIEVTAPQEVAAKRDELSHELFGADVDFATVEAQNGEYAIELNDGARLLALKNREQETRDYLRQKLRILVQLADGKAEFGDLIRIKRIKLDLMRHLETTQGAKACAQYLRSGQFPTSEDVGDVVRVREQNLAADLLAKGLIDMGAEHPGERKANIPGDIFDAARRDAGLSDVAAQDAAMGKGSDEEVCAFRIALIDRVLRQPGNVSAELLRLL